MPTSIATGIAMGRCRCLTHQMSLGTPGARDRQIEARLAIAMALLARPISPVMARQRPRPCFLPKYLATPIWRTVLARELSDEVPKWPQRRSFSPTKCPNNPTPTVRRPPQLNLLTTTTTPLLPGQPDNPRSQTHISPPSCAGALSPPPLSRCCRRCEWYRCVRTAIVVPFWPLVGAGVVHVAGGELGSALGFCRTAVALCRVVLKQNPR